MMSNIENNQAGILFLRRDKPSKVLSRKILDFFRKSDKKDGSQSFSGERGSLQGIEHSQESYTNPKTEFVSYGDNSFHEEESDNESRIIVPNRQLQECLWKYVMLDDLQGIISTLHKGSDVNGKFGEYGQTVLHEAGRRGHHKACELLIRAGADPNEQDDMGFIPLHLAIQFGRKEAVKSLLKYCSSVEIKNVYGDSAIHVASRFNRKSLIPIILEKPLFAPLNHLSEERSKSAPDLSRMSGLHTPLNEILKRDRVTFRGIPSTTSESSSSNDLSRPIEDIDIECCHHRVNLRNENGDTAIHIASALNHKSVAKKLLQYGAYSSIKNEQGLTPVDLAASKNHGKIVRLLRNPPKVLFLSNDNNSENMRVGHRQTVAIPKDVILKKDCKPGCVVSSSNDQKQFSHEENVTDKGYINSSKFYVHRSTSPVHSTSSFSSCSSCRKYRLSDSRSIKTNTTENDKSLSLQERINLSLYGSTVDSYPPIVHRESSDFSEKDRELSYQTINPIILPQVPYYDPSEKTRVVEIDSQSNCTSESSKSKDKNKSPCQDTLKTSGKMSFDSESLSTTASSTFENRYTKQKIKCSLCSKPSLSKSIESMNSFQSKNTNCNCEDHSSILELKIHCPLCRNCCNTRRNKKLKSPIQQSNIHSLHNKLSSNESMSVKTSDCQNCIWMNLVEHRSSDPCCKNNKCLHICPSIRHQGFNLNPQKPCQCVKSPDDEMKYERSISSINSNQCDKKIKRSEKEPDAQQIKNYEKGFEELTKSVSKECCYHCSTCHHAIKETFVDSTTIYSSDPQSKSNSDVSNIANKTSSDLNDRIFLLGESIRDKLNLLNTKYTQLESQEDKLNGILKEKNELTTQLKQLPVTKNDDKSYILPGRNERGIDVVSESYSKKRIESTIKHEKHISPKINELQEQIQKCYL